MLFSSVIFVFLFLPAVLFFYFIIPSKFLGLRNIVLLIFSLAFYFYGEPKYIAVMIFSILINYIFGLIVQYAQEKNKKGNIIVILSVIINLAVLVYFKYLAFITENVNLILKSQIIIPEIILPIGISFFTFQAMSYVFDIHGKKAKAQKNPLNVALYVCMFPQLMAGPIVRYETVSEEIRSRVFNLEDFSEGVIRFIYGLAKKIIIANAMGKISDDIFALSSGELSGKTAWLGAIAYSFQIFYDFSGYSDMAIGLGKIFGFHFLENFNFPYISKSITEFWRRWHISLSSWFKDYVYIPLGGNRVGRFRNLFNILVIWLLTGFWHGAAWNFIVWGLYFAVILILEKVFLLKFLEKLNKRKITVIFTHIYAIIFIIIGWVIFRSENLTYALDFLSKMFSPSSVFSESGLDNQVRYYITQYLPEWILSVLFSIPAGKVLSKVWGKREKKSERIFYPLRAIYVCVIFGLSVLYMIGSSFNPFIYFRF